MMRSISRVLALFFVLLAMPVVGQISSGDHSAVAALSRWPYQADPSIDNCFEGKDAALVVIHLGTGKRLEFGGKRIALRLTPCSTFKIPHALIGLECGILTGPEQRFPWDGSKRMIKAWERDHSLRSSMAYSVVWVYQWLAGQIGPARMQAWLDRFAYGNRDISSGQTRFWIGQSLTISAGEQAAFLEKLVEGRLPVASASLAAIREITCLERFPDGEYHGKTGSEYVDGHWTLGWWVGWLERGTDRYVFAANLRAPDGASGFATRRGVEKVLKRLGLLSFTREERLALDYQAFDQDLAGNSGWRPVGDSRCHLEAAKLLEDYLDRHDGELQPWQCRILRWHAGQMQAFAGETTAALAHFRKSYDSQEEDGKAPMRWNAYVRGTIAFLENDLPALKACREAMQRGPQDPKWVDPNRRIVDNLLAGFGTLTYREAYCRAAPYL